MNNKKLLSLILIIILIFGVAPYFVGNMAKNDIEKATAQISKMPGYTFQISDYDQGWFTSHATLHYGFDQHTLNILKDSEDIDQGLIDVLSNGITIDFTVAHGPVTFQNGINFALLTVKGEMQDFDHEAFKDFKERTKINSLLNTFVSVSYGGTTTVNANSPSFKADYSDISDEKLIFNFSGMEIQSTINADIDEYTADMYMDELSIEMKEATISYEQMIIRSHGNKINEFLWTGDGTTSMESIVFSAPDNMAFSMNNITSDYNLGLENDKALAFHVTFNFADFTANEISLNDFQFGMELNHLDLDAITFYAKSISESFLSANEETPTPEETAANIQLITTQVGNKLIKGSPELVISNMNFLLNDGYFKSDGKFSLNGEGLDNIGQLSDPEVQKERLAASANVKFNKQLALELTAIGVKIQMAEGGVDVKSMPKEQLDQMINVQASTALQSFITQGYIQLEGDEYSSHFDMKNGQSLINGKPLPIPGL